LISFLQSKITYLNLCASVASYISTHSGCMGEQQTKFATSPGCMGEQQTKFATSHFNEAGRKLKLAARLCTLCGIKGFCLQNPANPERTKGAYQLERSPKKLKKPKNAKVFVKNFYFRKLCYQRFPENSEWLCGSMCKYL